MKREVIGKTGGKKEQLEDIVTHTHTQIKEKKAKKRKEKENTDVTRNNLGRNILMGRSANPGTSESRIWGTSSQICMCSIMLRV
jgi:hypothetical protein